MCDLLFLLFACSSVLRTAHGGRRSIQGAHYAHEMLSVFSFACPAIWSDVAAVYDAVAPVLANAARVIRVKVRQKIRRHSIIVPEVVHEYGKRWSVSDVVHEDVECRGAEFK